MTPNSFQYRVALLLHRASGYGTSDEIRAAFAGADLPMLKAALELAEEDRYGLNYYERADRRYAADRLRARIDMLEAAEREV